MKKRMIAFLVAIAMIIGNIPVTVFAQSSVAQAVTIPQEAPFTAVTTDKGEVTEIKQMENVSYNGYSTYEDVPYYQITVPAGTKEVYVTYPASEDPFADEIYGSAYGYAAEMQGWTGSGISLDFESTDDGYMIILPLSAMVDTDGDWTPDTEGSFVVDQDGSVGYAVAVERNDYSPICFFTFAYAAAQEGEHVHSYDKGVITTEPTCTEKGVKTYTCSGCEEGTQGHSYTEEIDATGHTYDKGSITTPATCVTDGVKTYTCQNGCAEETQGHTKTEKINRTGHSYDEGVITKTATCREEGVKTFTCKKESCTTETEGHIKTESIPVTDHSYGDDKVCDECGFVDVSPEKDENGIYQIKTEEHLLWFAEAVNNGNISINGVLTENINLSSVENWPGIGNSTNRFAGSFDGQNHVITFAGSTWGVFGYVQGTSSNHVQIRNIIAEGNVEYTAIVHNVIYADVDHCVNRADVGGTGNNNYIAGIVGEVNWGSWQGNSAANITNCANEGTIKGSKNVAGIVGYARTRTVVSNCYNVGNITGENTVGGVVGYLQSYKGTCKIENSYNLGKITGSEKTGGIVGDLENSTEINNCYNAGQAAYAIAGYIYNNTVHINNTYYRGDLCSSSVPNTIADGTYYTKGRGIAKTSVDMSSEEMASLLGDAYKQSCPSPVLTRQEASEHTIEKNICVVCKQGNDMPVEYAVTFVTGTGYKIIGDTTFRVGKDYHFSVNISDGYDVSDNFGVYVNGNKVEAVEDGYHVEKPEGPFYITVTGVVELEGVVAITLPEKGNGYRVNPCEGYKNTVESGNDYKFKVTFVDGFEASDDFAVKANGEEMKADENGVYTIENIKKKQVITVEGVSAILGEKTVTIDVSITKGENEFLLAEDTNEIMLNKQLEIPYFDLDLYGLEKYYYNPYCYVDENGTINGQQKAGTRESAYGVVTSMHAFIYMTEVYYLGYDVEDAGYGYSHLQDSDKDGISDFEEAVSWTQPVGSSFMNLWGLGSNLNYHVNYEYPIAYEGWGSTSDQQALKNGDVLTIHMITGSASGSAFGLFVVNDENDSYDRTDMKDHATVKQGETIKLTHYLASQGDHYTTVFVKGENKRLYWTYQGDETVDVRDWNREDFGTVSQENLKTDDKGNIVIDTNGLEPGTYYIGAAGGFAAGSGKPGSDGFVSNGSEAGPAYFVLTVEKKEEPVLDNPFADVKEEYYYFDPVMWAVENKITNGISENMFGTGQTCTREQIVTFLWNYAGKPEPTTNVCTFDDVDDDYYYYKPILWAVEHGIVNGFSKTKFGVGEACTREQVVTFLWRYADKLEPTTSVCTFEDVDDTYYYYKPILWAVEHDIVNGFSKTKFGVGETCTREQVVTFLHRYNKQ